MLCVPSKFVTGLIARVSSDWLSSSWDMLTGSVGVRVVGQLRGSSFWRCGMKRFLNRFKGRLRLPAGSVETTGRSCQLDSMKHLLGNGRPTCGVMQGRRRMTVRVGPWRPAVGVRLRHGVAGVAGTTRDWGLAQVLRGKNLPDVVKRLLPLERGSWWTAHWSW